MMFDFLKNIGSHLPGWLGGEPGEGEAPAAKPAAAPQAPEGDAGSQAAGQAARAPAPAQALPETIPTAAAAAPASLPSLRSPGGVDLFPREAFMQVVREGAERDLSAQRAHESARGYIDLPPANGAAAERTREQYLGPTYSAIVATPRPMGVREQLEGEAALAAIPAALLAGAAKPAIEAGYGVIDRVPAALRRPLEKNFGLLIDTALAAPGAAISPVVGSTLDSAARESGRPSSAELRVPTYGQITMGCGETAAATILKAQGEPLSLADVDTQVAATGGNLLMDQEFRRRGLSLVTGAGDMGKLKSLVSSGYPVMVSIARGPTGSDHYAVVTGYDDKAKTVTINNYDAKGNTVKVPYNKFSAEWSAHKNHMTVVVPKRDTRLEPILKAGADARRPDTIAPGLSVSDFYVTKAGKVFVEGAFRHVSRDTDVTVRVNFNNREEALSRQLGGSLAVRQRVADGWWVGLKVEKMSVRGQDDNWSSFRTAPVAAYGSIEGPRFELRAGGERGAFQASAAYDLSRVISGMGVRASATVQPDGTYQIMGYASGTF